MAGRKRDELGLEVVQAVREYGQALRALAAAEDARKEAAVMMTRSKIEAAQKSMRAAMLQVESTRTALDAVLLDG